MAVTDFLPPYYGLVIVTFLMAYGLLMWASIEVTRARRKYGVTYPTMYAIPGITRRSEEITDESQPLNAADGQLLTYKECHEYNCIQRVHGNTVEIFPFFLVFVFIAGLEFPILASISGTLFLIGRIVYNIGYASAIPHKRVYGAFGYLGLLTLLGLTITVAYRLLSQARPVTSASDLLN